MRRDVLTQSTDRGWRLIRDTGGAFVRVQRWGPGSKRRGVGGLLVEHGLDGTEVGDPRVTPPHPRGFLRFFQSKADRAVA